MKKSLWAGLLCAWMAGAGEAGTSETRYAEILRVGDGNVTVIHRGVSLQTWDVASDAKITRNGKRAALNDLKKVDFAKITTEKRNQVVVATAIDARSDLF